MALFTAEQISRIRTLFDAGPVGLGDTGLTGYSHIYSYIAGVLPAGSAEQRWFAGAAEANGGRGAFSGLIREYSRAQMEMRGLGRGSDALMQEASNAVAVRALQDILGQNGDTAQFRQPDANGNVKAPEIGDIAKSDAIAVGRTLFREIPGDSAFMSDQNSGWAGTLMFSGLQSDQTYRLFGWKENEAQFDKVDDLRNLLIAREAFAIGAAEALKEYWAESPYQAIRDTLIGFHSIMSLDFNNTAQANSAIAVMLPSTSVVRGIALDLARFSNAELLDMLRRSVHGNDVATTPQGAFKSAIVAFIAQLGDPRVGARAGWQRRADRERARKLDRRWRR